MKFNRFGFKAKKTNSKKWLYAGFDDSEELLRWLLRDKDNERYDPAWIDRKTICQCTGLEDSEGNLIYENDILEIETPHGKDNGVVYYQELDTSFRVWQESFTIGLALVIEHIRTMGWKVKVIGNKFDSEVENDKNLH